MKLDTRPILVDTREKTPWSFRSQSRQCLTFGDYSILKGKHKIVIERKSLTDLYITLAPDRWDHFLELMGRAKSKTKHVFIFIEASLSEVYCGIRFSRLSGNYIMSKLIVLMELGIHVIFTGNAKKGPEFAETLLRKLG